MPTRIKIRGQSDPETTITFFGTVVVVALTVVDVDVLLWTVVVVVVAIVVVDVLVGGLCWTLVVVVPGSVVDVVGLVVVVVPGDVVVVVPGMVVVVPGTVVVVVPGVVVDVVLVVVVPGRVVDVVVVPGSVEVVVVPGSVVDVVDVEDVVVGAVVDVVVVPPGTDVDVVVVCFGIVVDVVVVVPPPPGQTWDNTNRTVPAGVTSANEPSLRRSRTDAPDGTGTNTLSSCPALRMRSAASYVKFASPTARWIETNSNDPSFGANTKCQYARPSFGHSSGDPVSARSLCRSTTCTSTTPAVASIVSAQNTNSTPSTDARTPARCHRT